MKDIFVSLEIAKKLKEIRFDEPCFLFYKIKDIYIDTPFGSDNICEFTEKSFFDNYNSWSDYYLLEDEDYWANRISAPTYEQVFKWFREKGYHQEIIFSGLKTDCKSYFFSILKDKTYIYSSKNYPDYEEAREQTILKLIELYQNKTK